MFPNKLSPPSILRKEAKTTRRKVEPSKRKKSLLKTLSTSKR